MINGLISCIANTRTSVPPPSLLNVFLLPCCLPERSTGSCCPAWRPQWRASCPPTTLTCGRGMVACSGCTRTWTTSSAMDWGMSRSAHEAHIGHNNKPFFCFCFNRTRMAFTKITPAYSHAWGKIKNADFARYVLCVLYLITRAVSVPSDSGMKTKTLCCTFSATLCCTEGAFALINCINTACLMRFWCMHLLRLGMFMWVILTEVLCLYWKTCSDLTDTLHIMVMGVPALETTCPHIKLKTKVKHKCELNRKKIKP